MRFLDVVVETLLDGVALAADVALELLVGLVRVLDHHVPPQVVLVREGALAHGAAEVQTVVRFDVPQRLFFRRERLPTRSALEAV